MKKVHYLNSMVSSKAFRFDKLVIDGIDNIPIFKINVPEIIEQEICLFHRDIAHGNVYCEMIHKFITMGLSTRMATPVVRFADGEYAFYDKSLLCNGLYQQAESIEDIQKAMPLHIEALEILSQSGILASLIYPGNAHREQKGLFSFFRKSKGDNSALKFIDFLYNHNIKLTHKNYLPFYVVYAYLTSKVFASIVHEKKLCIISSECNMDACRQWFARFSSDPKIVFAKIPPSYVATRWASMKEHVLSQVPSDVDLCLIGAGVGSILVCVDVATRFSIPAIDAGHVLNMMNGREDKSNGPRLYTIHQEKSK